MVSKKISILLAICLFVSVFVGMENRTKVQAAVPAPSVKKVTLYVGYENYSIQMKNLEKGSKVTYSSSDKKIAVVTSVGVITPVTEGKAVVTVKVTQSGKNYESQIAVTVKKPYVSITNKITEILEGRTWKFEGETHGLKKTSVVWTSSDKKIATIDAKTGVMKAVANGTVKITFQDKTSGKSAVCKVQVKIDEEALLDKFYTKYRDSVKNGEGSRDYSFIYLDADNIPECLVWLDWAPRYIMSYQKGKIVGCNVSLGDAWDSTSFYYTPRKGKFKFSAYWFSRANGYEGVTDFVELNGDFSLLANEVDFVDESYRNISGKRVSQREFTEYAESMSMKLTTECKAETAFNSMEEAFDAVVPVSERGPLSEKSVALKSAQEGNIVVFGNYEQDNNFSNGKEPIEWVVLKKEGKKLLLLSKKLLDSKQYNKMSEAVTWETCTLRKWLNDDFYKAAFSKKERTMIKTVTVKTAGTKWSGEEEGSKAWITPGGKDTKDKIFLLSLKERDEYITKDSMRYAKVTAYAAAQGARVFKAGECSNEEAVGAGYWWLRSPGGRANQACVEWAGWGDGWDCEDATSQNFGIRPVLWVEFD